MGEMITITFPPEKVPYLPHSCLKKNTPYILAEEISLPKGNEHIFFRSGETLIEIGGGMIEATPLEKWEGVLFFPAPLPLLIGVERE